MSCQTFETKWAERLEALGAARRRGVAALNAQQPFCCYNVNGLFLQPPPDA
jgi:hypothetical protein